ncbi:MAG: helix-turn-helix domain-containing protein [Actinobacteria bacterium]|nr:helix-turn-helix domain-containing protein [Actinomycetota bacterium]
MIEVARRVGRDPETVRRWIRAGKIRARKVGLQHMIDEDDLPASADATVELPASWRRTATGDPMPDVVAAVRSARSDH